jgi:hypothetical protein
VLRWKLYAVVGGAVVLFGSGFVLGRRGRTVIKDVHATQTSTNTQAKTTTTAAGQETHTEQKPVIVVKWKTRVIHEKDGSTVTETEGEQTKTADEATTTKATTSGTTSTTITEGKTKTEDRHTVVLAPSLPRYLIGLQGGLSVPSLLGKPADRQLIPFLPGRFAGALTFDVRMFGPVYGGVWASSSGAAGLTLRIGL